MFAPRKNLMRVVAVLAALFLCQCSKEGIEADFKVTLDSEHPLVHTVGRTYGDKSVEPDWFGVSFHIQNNTGYNIQMEEVIFYVAQEGDDPPSHFLDLGSLSETDIHGNTYDYTDYCLYPDGYSGPWKACMIYANDANDTGTVGDTTDENGTLVPGFKVAIPIIVYVDGVTATIDSDSKVYLVHMEIQGVIKDGTDELDRFQKRVVFTTR